MQTKHIVILSKDDLAPLIKKASGGVINDFIIEGIYPSTKFSVDGNIINEVEIKYSFIDAKK